MGDLVYPASVGVPGTNHQEVPQDFLDAFKDNPKKFVRWSSPNKLFLEECKTFRGRPPEESYKIAKWITESVSSRESHRDTFYVVDNDTKRWAYARFLVKKESRVRDTPWWELGWMRREEATVVEDVGKIRSPLFGFVGELEGDNPQKVELGKASTLSMADVLEKYTVWMVTPPRKPVVASPEKPQWKVGSPVLTPEEFEELVQRHVAQIRADRHKIKNRRRKSVRDVLEKEQRKMDHAEARREAERRAGKTPRFHPSTAPFAGKPTQKLIASFEALEPV